MEKSKVNLWHVFRLIFVIFSVYLLQDAFFRWDGISYYASFSKFIPSIALVSVLWSIVAFLISIVIWLLISVSVLLCHRLGWKLNAENLLITVFFSMMLGMAAWVVKLLFIGSGSSVPMKLIVLSSVFFLTIFLSWIFRGKITVIQDRITPLVWLFGVIVIISLPLVLYHTLIKEPEIITSQTFEDSFKAKEQRPNIILVTFDALTARNMSLYGYMRQTTPFISKWAKAASVFKRAESADNYTFPTTLSLMTGKKPWTHQQWNPHGKNVAKSKQENLENVAAVLKKDGYYTMAFVQNKHASVNRLGISTHFDIAPPTSDFIAPTSLVGHIDKLLYELFGNKILLYNWITKWDFLLYKVLHLISFDTTETIYRQERVYGAFLSAFDRNPPEPFFVWIHLLPPHDPYLAPEPYMGMFNSSSRLRTMKSQDELTQTQDGPYVKVDHDTVNIMRDRYDEFLLYSDKQYEYFINTIQEEDTLKNATIILSADHGESFQINYLGHGGNDLYEPVTHIPLIIKESYQTEGRIIHDLVEQVDISATIIDIAGISVPAWIEGRSLVPLLRGTELPPKPVFSMSLYRNPRYEKEISSGTIAVWEGDYKLIHKLKENQSSLFNLKKDPDELVNLFDKETEIGQHLLGIIKNNVKKANERLKNRKEI